MSNSAEPYANMSAQELLKNGPSLYSWMRKEEYMHKKMKVALKAFEWPMRFVILHQGCLYLYKDSKDLNFYEKHQLTSYRVSNAPEVGKYPWAFKLINDKEVKTLLFAVDSEIDLQKWTSAILAEKEEYCGAGNSHQYNYILNDLSGAGQRRRSSPPPIPRDTTIRPHSRSFPGPDSSDDVHLEADPYDNDEASSQSTLPRAPPQKDLIRKRSSLPPLPVRPHRQPPIGGQTSPTVPRHRNPTSELPAPPRGNSFKPNPPPPLPGRKEPRTDSRPPRSSPGMFSPTSKFMSIVIDEMQQELKAIDRQPSRPSSHGTRRQRPEGREDREVPQPSSWKPLPSSAFFAATDKERASSLLRTSPIGTYLVRWRESPDEKALAVRDLDVKGNSPIKHYKIFYSEGRGFALDHRGPHLKSTEELLNHYFENNLPNTSLKLKWPYGSTGNL